LASFCGCRSLLRDGGKPQHEDIYGLACHERHRDRMQVWTALLTYVLLRYVNADDLAAARSRRTRVGKLNHGFRLGALCESAPQLAAANFHQENHPAS